MSRKTLIAHYKDFEYGASQYRSGVKSVQQCADEIGVTRAVFFDYISKNGITRDLALAIRNKTTEMLAGDIIDANGRMPTMEEDIVQINATMQASVIRSHRSDIDRFRRLAMAFLAELEGMTVYQDTMEDVGTILRSEDKNGVDKLNDVYKRVISLPGRTDTLKKLGDTLKVLILLERQAFGMRDDYEDDEIKRAKIGDQPKTQVSNFDAITSRFMRVMSQEVTDVVQPAP